MDVFQILVSFYLDQDQYEKATVIIDGMLSGSPDNSDLHYLGGVAHDELANHDKAMEHLINVAPESRFYKNAVIHVAFLYQKMDEIDKAVDYLRIAIGKTPEDPDFYHYLGVLYEEAENYPEAEAVLKEGLKIDRNNPKLHFRLGVVYDKLDRKEDCIEQMKIVIELEPENANALNYLGYTWADMNRNLEEAEELIRRAIELKPDDGYITDSLGWVFYRQGRYEEAVEALEKAIDLVSDDPIILEHMGDAYLKVNQKNKALEFYEKSLEVKEEKDKADLEKKILELKHEILKEEKQEK
jgi:tetratricopeptide (TPR) repeat protein